MGSPVLGTSYQKEDYLKVDLSIQNKELLDIDYSNPNQLWNYIQQKCKTHQAKVAYGGYMEQRQLYQKSSLFKSSQQKRDIHLGIDLWVAAGSAVYSPMDGYLFGFANNDAFLDYGPTLIIHHPQHKLYSLYGHLSVESLRFKKKGEKINQSDQIARIGHENENGGWAPHLHFQLIRNLQHYLSDYPGVCSKTESDFFRANCPDPSSIALSIEDNL